MFITTGLFILGCCTVAYIHKVAANFVYYLHEPAIKPLKDIGFMLINEIPPKYQVISEVLFFIPVVLVTLHILCGFIHYLLFSCTSSYFSTTAYMMLWRFGMNVSVAAILRCVSFLSTVLPGPRYHCRKGSVHYNPPKTTSEIFTRSDMFNGCGDLIFSNHTTLHLIAILTLVTYESMYQAWYVQATLYINAGLFMFFTLAARKHYTVDIVVACYVIPLLWSYLHNHFSDTWLLSL